MTNNLVPWEKVEADLLSDPDVQREYDLLEPEFMEARTDCRYKELLLTFPPRPITNDQELDATQQVVDSLLDKSDLSPEESQYLNLLGTLIYEYEQQHPVFPTEVTVSLLITGSLDPDRITQHVGLQPTDTWRAGDPVDEDSSLRHGQDGWKYAVKWERTREEDVLTIGGLVDRFLCFNLDPYWDNLVYLCGRSDKFHATLCIHGHLAGEDNVCFCLDASIVEALDRLGASINIDLQ